MAIPLYSFSQDFDLEVTHATTTFSCDGAIAISNFRKGCEPYTIQWYDKHLNLLEEEGFELSGVLASRYYYKIEDCGCCYFEGIVEIECECPKITNVDIVGCTGGRRNGSIRITTNYDSLHQQFSLWEVEPLPYYYWSNGGETQLIDSLSPGDYIVTIYDYFHCKVIDTFTVTNKH